MQMTGSGGRVRSGSRVGDVEGKEINYIEFGVRVVVMHPSSGGDSLASPRVSLHQITARKPGSCGLLARQLSRDNLKPVWCDLWLNHLPPPASSTRVLQWRWWWWWC